MLSVSNTTLNKAYSILLYSILFYSIYLYHSILFYFILLYYYILFYDFDCFLQGNTVANTLKIAVLKVKKICYA